MKHRLVEDIELGSHGSKWRHGWIPLNATAAAIKAKKFGKSGGKGGTRSPNAPAAKVRLRSDGARPSGPGRTKGAPPSKYTDVRTSAGNLITRSKHVDMPSSVDHSKTSYPGLVKAIEQGDHHARAEKHRRDMAAYDGTPLAKVKKAQNVQAARAVKPNEISGHANADSMRKSGANLATGKQAEHQPTKRQQQLNMLPGTREHLGHKYIVSKPRENPSVPSDAHGVMHSNGATIGYIKAGETGGLRIGGIAGNELPEHEVKNVKEAIAGLHASWTIHSERAAAKKAAEDERLATQRRAYEAQKSLEIAHRDADKRAADIKSAQTERARHAAASRKILNTTAGPKSTNTKKDSAAMQKVRAAQAEQLSRTAVDLHEQNAQNLKPGQAASFRLRDGELRIGHVVHASGNKGDAVHLASVNPKTGKGETHTMHPSRHGSMRVPVVTHDAAANKGMIEREQRQHNLRVGNTRTSVAQGESFTSRFKTGEAKFKIRTKAKAGK